MLALLGATPAMIASSSFGTALQQPLSSATPTMITSKSFVLTLQQSALQQPRCAVARFPALQQPRCAVARFRTIRCGEQGTYETNDLVLAARKGKIDALSQALGRDDTDVDLAVSCTKISAMDGASALVWAARQGQIDCVSLLLTANANVNAATRSGWTALYAAALNGHDQIVEMLVARGASVADALSIGDERTNINLKRMVGTIARNEVGTAAPPLPPPPSVPRPLPPPLAVSAAADNQGGDWKLAQKQAAGAAAAPSSATTERVLSGMNELEALRLRLEWKAPPTKEEQSAADAARQTLFKYRYDQIQHLESKLASGGGDRTSALAAPPVVPRSGARTATPAAAAVIVPTASASSAGGGMDDVLSRLEAVEKAALLSRLEMVETALAGLTSSVERSKQADPKGYADGYAAGFAAGFAAGRASE